MAAIIDSLIVILSPFLILAYLLGAFLVYRRKVKQGENGLYTAMIMSLVTIAGSWLILEISYTRQVLGLINSPEDIFSVRVYRLILLLLSIYNLEQYRRGMK